MGIPICFLLLGAAGVGQELAREGLDIIHPIHIRWLVVGLGLLVGWTCLVYSSYRFTSTSSTVTVLSFFRSFEYRPRTVERQKLKQVVIHSNKVLMAQLSLQCEDQPDIVVTNVRAFDAERVRSFIEGALGGQS